MEIMYLRGLLRVLLSRGGGSTGADAAAVGMRRAIDSLRLRPEPGATCSPDEAIQPPGQEAMVCRAVGDALMLDGLPYRRQTRGGPWKPPFSSLQLAPLCRGLVLMELTDRRSPPNEEMEGENSGRDFKEPWEWAIVRRLLASSRDVQDLFVQQVLLATSAPLGTGNSVARLLHSIESSQTPEERGGASDSQSEVDEENEDDDEYNAGPLLRQVHRVAVLWSSALSNGVRVHQQRVITAFLQEALKILPDPSSSTTVVPCPIDPVSQASSGAANVAPNVDVLGALTANDTLVTLMNGVSERLHSTDPGIRRDGMHVAQALGKYVLNQPVVFDELNAQESGPKGELSHRRSQDRPSSPSSKQPSTSSRQIVRRRRPRYSQTDPDALYVSDSESSSASSAEDDAASSGGWSDDSDWDEEKPKNRGCNVEDDEEDLREVPLPLYLQDCLDLLRTSETVDGAVASHLAALQTLPKLVRERPGDLADFGPLIAKQLVAMENKFQLDDFDAMVQQPLCALVAEEPLIVGMALIEDMFQDGSLYNRTLALTALNEGAWELSGNRLRDSTREIDERMLYVLVSSYTIDASSLLILRQSPAGSTNIRQTRTYFVRFRRCGTYSDETVGATSSSGEDEIGREQVCQYRPCLVFRLVALILGPLGRFFPLERPCRVALLGILCPDTFHYC
jgi:Telomere length regulation protein